MKFKRGQIVTQVKFINVAKRSVLCALIIYSLQYVAILTFWWETIVAILRQMSEGLIRIRVELSSLVGRERFSIPEKIMVLVDTKKLTTIADVRYYLINEVNDDDNSDDVCV